MTSLTDLREVVDVVIGVDTHVHTHSAAVVDAATGGVLDEITVDATARTWPPARMSRRDEPTFDERCYQVSWADVVLDGRDAADFWVPLPADPARMSPPGDAVGDSGVLHLRLDDGGQVGVTAQLLRLPATRPAIFVRVRCPTGISWPRSARARGTIGPRRGRFGRPI